MTDEEETALLAQGQAEADRQMLETLLSLDPVAREQFDYIAAHYSGMPLVDFVQEWRGVYGGNPWVGADGRLVD